MNESREQREFVRVDVGGDVFFRLIKPERIPVLENKILQGDRGAGSIASEWEGYSAFELRVLRRMDAVEAKLDAVLDLLAEKSELASGEPLRKGALVNISASGLVFTTRPEHGLDPGKIIEMKVNPLGYLGPPVTTLAQVVYQNQVEGEGLAEVAVTYKTIGGYDREQLVGYTFRQMRRVIQSKNQEQGS